MSRLVAASLTAAALSRLALAPLPALAEPNWSRPPAPPLGPDAKPEPAPGVVLASATTTPTPSPEGITSPWDSASPQNPEATAETAAPEVTVDLAAWTEPAKLIEAAAGAPAVAPLEKALPLDSPEGAAAAAAEAAPTQSAKLAEPIESELPTAAIETAPAAGGLLAPAAVAAEGEGPGELAQTSDQSKAATPPPAAPAGEPPPQDEASARESTPRPATQTRSRYYSRERWENGFDVKLTDLFDRKATDLTAPTIMLGAQWNYKFVTDTFLGLAVGGAPQSMAFEKNGAKTSFTTYYFGLNLAQGVYETAPFRVAVSLAAGEGVLYLRTTRPGQEAVVKGGRYTFIEPGAFVTFYTYAGLEMGVTLSYRQAILKGKVTHEDQTLAKNDDLSSLAYGLTFRTQRH